MNRPKCSLMAWCAGFLFTLLVSAEAGHAQQWSAWQTLNDGYQNLLTCRTRVVSDSTAATGAITEFEVKSNYLDPVSFEMDIEMLLINTGDQQVKRHARQRWTLGPGTVGSATYDALGITSMGITEFAVQPTTTP